MKEEKFIYFKKENSVNRYFFITKKTYEENLEGFECEEYFAGIRIQRLQGNKNNLIQLTKSLELGQFQLGLPEKYTLTETFGLVEVLYEEWTVQRYFDIFEQKATIFLSNNPNSLHIKKWFNYLIENQLQIREIVKEKILIEYSHKDDLVGLWAEEEIREVFPPIETDKDIFNMLTEIYVRIYEERMGNDIYFINAECPWDEEHGIQIEINLDELKNKAEPKV